MAQTEVHMDDEMQAARDALASHLKGVSGVGPVVAHPSRGTLEISVEAHVGETVTDCLPSSWHGFTTEITVKPTQPPAHIKRDYRCPWS